MTHDLKPNIYLKSPSALVTCCCELVAKGRLQNGSPGSTPAGTCPDRGWSAQPDPLQELYQEDQHCGDHLEGGAQLPPWDEPQLLEDPDGRPPPVPPAPSPSQADPLRRRRGCAGALRRPLQVVGVSKCARDPGSGRLWVVLGLWGGHRYLGPDLHPLQGEEAGE